MKKQAQLEGRIGENWLIRIPAGAWDLIEGVRNLPGRSWNQKDKLWQAPDSAAARAFLADLGLIDLENPPNIQDEVEYDPSTGGYYFYQN